jgi:hypothetical protein
MDRPEGKQRFVTTHFRIGDASILTETCWLDVNKKRWSTYDMDSTTIEIRHQTFALVNHIDY